jgi:hypothetical protein
MPIPRTIGQTFGNEQRALNVRQCLI